MNDSNGITPKTIPSEIGDRKPIKMLNVQNQINADALL